MALPDATHSAVTTDDLAPWRTVRDAIGDMAEPITLREAKARGQVERSNWHIVRELSRKNIERIKAAKAGETWTHIPEHLRPNCHRDGYIGFTNVYGRMVWDRPSPTITGAVPRLAKGASAIRRRIGRSLYGRQRYYRHSLSTTALILRTWSMSAI